MTTNGLFTFAQPPLGISTTIAKDLSEITSANEAIERTLFTDGVPGGTLSTTNAIIGFADLLINSISPTNFLTIRVKYDGQSFFIPIVSNSVSIKTAALIHIDFTIRSRGTTNSQNAVGRAYLSPINLDELNFGAPNVIYTTGRAPLSVDSTVLKSLSLSVEWGPSSITSSVTGDGFFAVQLR
jgi:hypothetical protein